jgi:hypothetical protein
VRPVNLTLRFILEVAALVAVGYWGWKTGEGAMRWVLMIGVVASVVVVWILFVSRDPAIQTARPFRLIIEFAVWFAAGAALYASGQRALAIAFANVGVPGSNPVVRSTEY